MHHIILTYIFHFLFNFQYAKASNQNKEAPMQNPDWDDWNAHQNDDDLWEEYENRHKQAAANGCETFNEVNSNFISSHSFAISLKFKLWSILI